MTDYTKRIASPEWVVADRADIGLDPSLQEGWVVNPAPLARGLAYTDFSLHEMALPEGDSDQAKAVRVHEMVHARISPTSVPQALIEQLGVSTNAIRIAEEMRVNLVARHVANQFDSKARIRVGDLVGDVAHLSDGSEKGLADSCVERNSWNDALSLFLGTYNTEVHKVVKRRLIKNPMFKENLAFIEKDMDSNGWKFDTRRFTPISRRRLTSTDPLKFSWVEKSEEHSVLIPEGFMLRTFPLANKIEGWMQQPPAELEKELKQTNARRRRDTGSQWEHLRFGMTSLTENTGSFIGKRKRPAMTGKYPSRPDRLLTDPERRIFREVVRARGGVVVFDCSGSMGVSHETVRETVKQFAGALIVVYTNNTNGGGAPNAWVVAKNGRMITESDFNELPLHCGNGVDGPILRWALRQRKSNKDFILWVSDGQVTGKNDDMHDDLIRECANLSVRNNIVGVDTCDQAIELLATIKRTGAVPKNKYCRLITNWVRALEKEKD